MYQIAIYGKNREEWVLSDYSGMMSGIVSVTLYDTLGYEFIEYILDQTKIKTISLSADKVKRILKLK